MSLLCGTVSYFIECFLEILIQSLPPPYPHTHTHTCMHMHTHHFLSWGKRAAHNRAQIVYYIAENLELRHDEVAQRIASMTGGWVCVCVGVCVCMRICKNNVVDSTQCTLDVRKFPFYGVSVLQITV